jgi:hypothetical protein
VVCTAEEHASAQQGAWEFHNQDCPGFSDTPEKMLTIGLSPTGHAPATHYLCTRHVDKKELDRIEVYQQARVARGVPRVPVTYYPSDHPISADHTVKESKQAHETEILTQLGLRRII